MSLEKVVESLTEQLPDTKRSITDRLRTTERWLTIIIGSGFTLFVAAILWALIYKIIILKGEVLEGTAFLALFIALVTALILVVYRESLREAASKRRLSDQKPAPGENTKDLLPESHFEPVPSVTEQTTRSLFTKRGKKKQ
jgi:hypothetical protein